MSNKGNSEEHKERELNENTRGGSELVINRLYIWFVSNKWPTGELVQAQQLHRNENHCYVISTLR